MKGTFIYDNTEYTLDVKGETWTQGERIMGSFSVKSPRSNDLSSTGVYLAFVNSKKYKAKDAKAYKILQESLCKESSLRFSFPLPNDCPISESLGSLCILCGKKENLFEGGHLELNIRPHKILSDIMQIFEFQYRFKFKSFKNKKNFIETTVTLPDAKKYSSVQQLKLLMKMDGDKVVLNFLFKLKKVDFTSGTMSTINENLEVLKELSPSEYLIYGDSIHQAEICKQIDEVLDQIKVKSFV